MAAHLVLHAQLVKPGIMTAVRRLHPDRHREQAVQEKLVLPLEE